MGVYLYPNNTETPLKNAYIWIPFPTSIVLDKSVINLTNIWDTAQLTATIEPTVSDKSITWSSDDTTVATVSTTWLVTCVTPWTCTITVTTVNGLTASCGVTNNQWWQPWVNTVVYFPFDTDFNDYSWNWYNLTNNWWVAIESVNWVTCANFKDQPPYWLSRATWSIITSWTYTFLAWMNMDTNSWTYNPRIFGGKSDWFILWNRQNSGWVYPWYWSNTWVPYTAWWHLVCFVWNTSSGSYDSYKDWVYLNSWTWATWGRTWLLLWANENNSSSNLDRFIGQMSKVIFENRNWTAQEISDYYDQTKSLYGIS